MNTKQFFLVIAVVILACIFFGSILAGILELLFAIPPLLLIGLVIYLIYKLMQKW